MPSSVIHGPTQTHKMSLGQMWFGAATSRGVPLSLRHLLVIAVSRHHSAGACMHIPYCPTSTTASTTAWSLLPVHAGNMLFQHKSDLHLLMFSAEVDVWQRDVM